MLNETINSISEFKSLIRSWRIMLARILLMVLANNSLCLSRLGDKYLSKHSTMFLHGIIRSLVSGKRSRLDMI